MNAQELKSIRESLGLSQAQLASVMGVSPAAVAHWENGRSPIPTVYVAIILKLKERISNTPAKDVGTKVAGFLLIGGIVVFLSWLFSNDE